MTLSIYKQHALSDLMRRRRGRQTMQAAIDRAYAAFNRSYPRWTAALFDEHFVARTVAIWLRAPQNVDVLTPHTLAGAWAAQLTAQPSRREALQAECMPAAAEFLRLLRAELEASSITSSL